MREQEGGGWGGGHQRLCMRPKLHGHLNITPIADLPACLSKTNRINVALQQPPLFKESSV